jgi:hypothetical protein
VNWVLLGTSGFSLGLRDYRAEGISPILKLNLLPQWKRIQEVSMQITVPTWLWAIVFIAPALITGGVVLWSQRMADNRERGQRTHQLKLEEMKLEEARQQRLRDDRIKAYIDFSRLTYPYGTTDPSPNAEELRAYSAIAVLGGSPKSTEAARLLHTRIVELRDVTVRWANETKGQLAEDPRHKKASQAVATAWEDFVNTIREELQV